MNYCKTFGDYSMVFCNSVKSTRNGFKHVCDWTLYYNGIPIHYGTNKVYYINRTWETYQYRTVMRSAIAELRENIKIQIKEDYKTTNNLKRTGIKSKKVIEGLWKTNEQINALLNIYNQL